MTALRGAAMAGLLATHALAGQPLNATPAVNYTRCVFQKVRSATCALKGPNSRSRNFFKDGPTASRAEAFALCDADPECDAVQQYGDKALINNNETAWAEPCGADICYMKCHDLGKDECGRTMLEEDSKKGKEGRRLFDVDDEILLDDADVEDAIWEYEERRLHEDGYEHSHEPAYESPAQHVYTCRPYGEEPGIRSPLAFSLCLIAAILGGPLVYNVGVKLSRRYNCKEGGKCGYLEWSLFYWFFSAIWLIIGFGLLAGYFGPQDESDNIEDCEGDVLLHLGIGYTSAAGFLLVLSLWLGQFWWRFHREQDMKVSPKSVITQRRQSRAVSAFSAAAMKVSADTDLYKLQLAADLIMARRANDKNAAERVIDALGGGEHGILQAFMVLDKDTNGYVTATELRRVIPTNVPVAEVNAMLREADLEDDGRLNYEEFIRFVDPKGESWSRTMSVIKAIGKQAKATPEAEPIMTGTVVEAEPAREPPPLHDIVDALKQNLGLDGNFQEVVNAGCLQLGVPPTGSLQEKGDACWRAMEE